MYLAHSEPWIRAWGFPVAVREEWMNNRHPRLDSGHKRIVIRPSASVCNCKCLRITSLEWQAEHRNRFEDDFKSVICLICLESSRGIYSMKLHINPQWKLYFDPLPSTLNWTNSNSDVYDDALCMSCSKSRIILNGSVFGGSSGRKNDLRCLLILSEHVAIMVRIQWPTHQQHFQSQLNIRRTVCTLKKISLTLTAIKTNRIRDFWLRAQ